MQEEYQNKDEECGHHIVIKVSKISMFFEAVLTVFKFIAGVIGHSQAMLSDAIHSASDALSTIVVMVGVRLAEKEADEKHPYGHERMESVAALLLGLLLGVTGAGIGYKGLLVIVTGAYKTLVMPSAIALAAAIVSILVKEAMYWFARYFAKKAGSTALMADAWHHRSDALSSIGSLIGIYGAQKGFLILEPIASVVISFFILKVAFSITQTSLNEMLDCRGETEVEENLRNMVLRQNGVRGICVLKTRQFGTKLYVDLDVYVDNEISLDEAITISNEIHDSIEQEFAVVKHVLVRVIPKCQENEMNIE